MSSNPPAATEQSSAPPQDSVPASDHGLGTGPETLSTSDNIEVKCGPLLNYKGLGNANSASPTWRGSVLIVTVPSQKEPELNLRCLGAFASTATADTTSDSQTKNFRGEKLYEDPRGAFWRFVIDLPLQAFEAKWEYNIPNMRHLSGSSSASTKVFCVPAATQSMRIMFHSCNGFSVGTDEDAFSGCALWSDVLRQHEQRPIHVMIGGGDRKLFMKPLL